MQKVPFKWKDVSGYTRFLVGNMSHYSSLPSSATEL